MTMAEEEEKEEEDEEEDQKKILMAEIDLGNFDTEDWNREYMYR